MTDHLGQLVCPTCRGKGTVPDPDARCRCGHKRCDHHYDGGCCVEVDRYECCRCSRFRVKPTPPKPLRTVGAGEPSEPPSRGQSVSSVRHG